MTGIQTHALANGLTLALEPIAGVGSVGLTWLVRAGTATEPVDRLGLGSMWSELLLRGAGELDSRAQADAFDRLGMSRSTRAGTLAFRLGGTMLADRVDGALGLLADMVRRPTMDAESIKPARDLALQSLASLADEPQERAALAARQRHRPDPINRSGLGTETTLKAITRDDLAMGWHGRAVPGGSILVLAGAIEPDAILARVEELIGDWLGDSTNLSYELVGERGYGHEVDQSNQVQIFVLHDAPAEVHDDALLERVVSCVLSGGMSGRLFTEVREKRGLCYAVSASYGTSGRYGTVSAYVGTTPERAQESLDVLVGELVRIGTPKGRVTSEEFERAVVGMKSRLVFSGESTSARASAIAGDLLKIGRARTLDELAEKIDALTLDQINDYLGRRSMGTMTIQSLGPEPLTPPSV